MTENTREVENILILGNGFDLAMGRRTSYVDFLDFLSVVPNYLHFYDPGKNNRTKNKLNQNETISEENNYVECIGKRLKDNIETAIKYKKKNGKWFEWLNNEFLDKSTLFLFSLFTDEIQEYIFLRKKGAKPIFLIDYIKSTLERYEEVSNEVKYRKLYATRGLKINENSILSLYENRIRIKNYLHRNSKNDRFIEKNRDLYNDLMSFIDRLEKADNCPDYDLSLIISLYDAKKRLQISIKDNSIFNFISENKLELGKNWSSLELNISDLANALSDIKQNIKDYEKYFNSNAPELVQVIDGLKAYESRLSQDMSSIISTINDIDYKTSISISDFAHKSNPMAHAYIIDNIRKLNGDDKPLQSVIDELNEKLIKDLENLTDWLEFYLTYLDKVEDIKVKEDSVLSKLDKVSESKVINFNYTDTITKYDVSKNNIHFIHGRLNFERKRFPINQMVFGIEDKESEVEDISTDLIPYQKFYQRVVKETGNDYEEFFKTENDKLILVFGHSVDPLDKEIFRNCFRLLGDYVEKDEKAVDEKDKVNHRFIFAYYNEESKRSIAKNLAIILGKNRFVTLTGQKKIQFVQNNDRIKMQSILKEWEASRKTDELEK